MIAAESKKSGLSSALSRRFLDGGWKEKPNYFILFLRYIKTMNCDNK